MKKNELVVHGVYANEEGTRFRYITAAGDYPLYTSQEDHDSFQFLAVFRGKKGLKLVPGGRTAKGERKEGAIFSHITRTSMAAWAERWASAQEIDKVMDLLDTIEGALP